VLSFARLFAEKGHEVTVMCEFPNYPDGKLDKKYKCKLFEIEKFENFRIVRTAVIPSRRTHIIMRLINYASFFVSSFVIGFFLSRPNVIVAFSPPLTVGLSGVFLSIVKSSPLVGDIQDLWPEYAIAIGAIKNRLAVSVFRFIEKVFYWRCATIITIASGLKKYLDNKLSPGKNVFIVHNGSSIPDMPLYSNRIADCFRKAVINVCYAGQIGLPQPVEDIIDAAKLTIDDDSIRYTIVGDGVRRKSLEKEAITRGLTNIVFTGVLSQKETIEIFLKSDLGIVTLLEIEVFKSALPTKFFDYMAAGLPIILGVDGIARDILEEFNTGLYYRPGFPKEMVKKIRWFQANPNQARSMGLAGRNLVFNSFSRSDLAISIRFPDRTLQDKWRKLFPAYSIGGASYLTNICPHP
jgi:glycosyltransferase involved in cell wall biosynthesis